jgi:biopolymer transport protein ExbD
VTRDFMAAVVIHPQWILNKPIAQTAKLYLSDLFKRDLGIDMKDAEQVVILVPAKLPNQNRTATFEMAAIIRLPAVGVDSDGLLEKVDANTMVRQLLDRPERVTDGPNVYYVGRSGSAAFVADNRTIVRAPRNLLVRMIGSTKPQGILAEALAKADLNSDVVGVIANTGLARQSLFVAAAMARQQLRPDHAEQLGRVPDSILSATVAMNLSPGAPISLTLNATNDEAAEMLARLSRVGLDETRLRLTELGATRVPSATITADELALRSAFELVGTATAVQKGDQVVVSTRTPSGLADAIMSSVIMRAKKSALDAQRRNQLKQLGLAMHNYHDVNKSFPPVEHGLDNQFDKDGKPLLSWRVHILPFLGEEAADLYREFRLNEPWNSEHNTSLLDQMPSVFKTADSPTKTSMLAVVGPGTIYEGKRGVALKEITDGTANTILLLLAGDDKAISWTKPEDLPLVEADPITAIGKINGNEFQAVFCDGSVQSLHKDLDPASLRNLLIRNDGNTIDRKQLRPKRPASKSSEQGNTSATGTDAAKVSVVINVRADGTTDFEDRKVTLEDLKTELKSLRTKTQLSVVISADRAAPLQAVTDVMTGLRSLGIRDVTVRNATPRRR